MGDSQHLIATTNVAKANSQCSHLADVFALPWAKYDL